MNELEKQAAEQAESTLENAAPQEGKDLITPKKENERQKEESAVESTVKTTEESAGECSVDSSPALDIAEAADEIEKTSAKKNAIARYHSMDKKELIEELKRILDADDMEMHKEVAAIKQTYYILHNKELSAQMEAFVEAGNPPEAFSAEPDADEAEMKALLAEYRDKRNKYLEEKEAVRKKNLEAKQKLVDELNHISEDIDNINLQFAKFQQLQQDFKAAGEVPPGAENDIWKKYQLAVEQFYDRLKMNKELRDLDFKKNLELKNLLIEKARQLQDVTDPIEAFKSLQSLHDQWREIGPVAREIREEIWNNFKEASTIINKRHQDYFQSRKENEQANEESKTAICEKAEAIDLAALKTYADWDNATKNIIELQEEWRKLGFASKKMNNILFSRFRKVCDDFFTAKAEFFKKTKEEFKENLARKEALCEKAEALVERYEEKEAFDQIQALQKEWKTIGVVRRRQGDEVWKRFCSALDAFYDARKKLFSGRRDEENENLKTKQEIIEQLKDISEESERKDVIGLIRELQDKWQQTGHVPFKQKDAINAEYRRQLDRLFGAFDIKESRQKIHRYENELKKMEGDESKIGRERDKLLRAIENRRAELKTIENNLGFFNVKSSAGNSMLKDFERKIQKIKEEITEIEEKIKILDKEEQKEEV